MNRGKDDENVVGPMFPRLHVNDTEKRGPKAPPRNKMALYEQFTIPSQRFNPGLLPLCPNTSSNTVSPACSSQGNGPERSGIYPVHLPSQTLNHRAENNIARQSDAANLNTSLTQLEHRKKVDEDDFRVPIYVHSRIDQSNDKTLESFDGRKLNLIDSRSFGCSVPVHNGGDRDPKQSVFLLVNMGNDMRSENEGLPQVSRSSEQPIMFVKNVSTGENDSLVRQAKVTPNQEYQERPVSNISRLRQADACIQWECGAGSQSNDIGHGDGLVESTRDTDKGNPLLPRGSFCSTENQTSLLEASNDSKYHDTRNVGPIQKGNLDESENFSKVSMVENISSLKISPDDVVGKLGQKRFWKARREIANQQRVFAVQVFELHRLIKVQQLIAGSPDLLLEDDALLVKSPLKGSTLKKLSLEYVVKPQQQNLKCKDDSEMLNHKMECSAENAVGKTSLISLKNGSHHPNYTPFSGNLHLANVGTDSRMGPWCFDQPPGHQWLIPVMSPSEGLIYKPYPGPGFTGTICRGYVPFGLAPPGCTFMNPAYGVPAPHQAIGLPADTPPGIYPSFLPYGMPAINPAMSGSCVEQVNQFPPPGSHGHASGGGVNSITHNQSSCNLPVQRNGAISHVMKCQASKQSELLQGSTASSPSEMAEGIRTGQITEGMAPVVPEGVPQSLGCRQQLRVIKVVPHNPRSATESVARIFQSIQEERKQYDLV